MGESGGGEGAVIIIYYDGIVGFQVDRETRNGNVSNVIMLEKWFIQIISVFLETFLLHTSVPTYSKTGLHDLLVLHVE